MLLPMLRLSNYCVLHLSLRNRTGFFCESIWKVVSLRGDLGSLAFIDLTDLILNSVRIVCYMCYVYYIYPESFTTFYFNKKLKNSFLWCLGMLVFFILLVLYADIFHIAFCPYFLAGFSELAESFCLDFYTRCCETWTNFGQPNIIVLSALNDIPSIPTRGNPLSSYRHFLTFSLSGHFLNPNAFLPKYENSSGQKMKVFLHLPAPTHPRSQTSQDLLDHTQHSPTYALSNLNRPGRMPGVQEHEVPAESRRHTLLGFWRQFNERTVYQWVSRVEGTHMGGWSTQGLPPVGSS